MSSEKVSFHDEPEVRLNIKCTRTRFRIIVIKDIWRMGWDSNPRDGRPSAGFQDRCLQPLGHPSSASASYNIARKFGMPYFDLFFRDIRGGRRAQALYLIRRGTLRPGGNEIY